MYVKLYTASSAEHNAQTVEWETQGTKRPLRALRCCGGVRHARDGRGVSGWYGWRDAACPVSTGWRDAACPVSTGGRGGRTTPEIEDAREPDEGERSEKLPPGVRCSGVAGCARARAA